MISSPASADAARPRLGPSVPQYRGRLLHAIGHAMLRLAGWQLAGTIPDLPRFLIIVAPHTSNWDFVVAVATKWALGLKVSFLGKDTLFLPPLGWLMRRLGGIPVDRRAANAMVDRSAAEFARREQLILVLAPEGTRRKVEKWRSGFWHIARSADVPIVCAALDWKRRVVRFGPTVLVRADTEPADDIARIKANYADVRGYDPALHD